MDAVAFVRELDAFKAERLSPIVGPIQTSLLGGGANPLFDYLRGLSTTVERLAAGLFTLESIAYEVNENFMAFCDRRGDAETVRIYREYIQPDELRHHRLGWQLLAKYAREPESQQRAKEVVGRVLEIATAARAQAAARMGTACFPGC